MICPDIIYNRESTNVSLARAKTPTLLQTAHIVASNPENSIKRVRTRLNFDLGSKDSYITEGLGLKKERGQRMRITGFGGSSSGVKMYELCYLMSQFHHDSNTVHYQLL